jgi:hypothetical protein
MKHLSMYQLELALSMLPNKRAGVFRDESDLNASFTKREKLIVYGGLI